MVAEIQTVPGSPSWFRLARLAKLLSSLTLVWLGIEGVVGVVAGILAGSIALVAFGLDSAIEGVASIIVIWRFTGTRTISPAAERRAQKWVAVSFFLLAPYVAAEAIETLIEGAAAETSWLGIGLTAGTLVLCPWLGRANADSDENSHRFQSKPATCSDRSQPGWRRETEGDSLGSGGGRFVKLCGFCGSELAQRFSLQLDAMRGVHQTVEHGVSDGRVADMLVP